MNELEIKTKIKQILIDVLKLTVDGPDSLKDDQPLFGTENEPGLFEDSLMVLEVTSVMMSEFDVPPSIFGENSFQTVNTLVKVIIDYKKKL